MWPVIRDGIKKKHASKRLRQTLVIARDLTTKQDRGGHVTAGNTGAGLVQSATKKQSIAAGEPLYEGSPL